MELNDKQKEIIKAGENKIIVLAAAASGKTTILVERIRYLLDIGIAPQSIVAITFTNAAAENIRNRVGEKSIGAFIGTIHGYANYLLVSRGIDTTKILNKEDFDRLFELVKENKDCIKPVEHLLLDEAQDSTDDQFEFLIDMIKPKNYFLVGDHKQSIYRWNNANPEYLFNLTKQEDVKTYPLNQNYRNGKNILSYAKSIIRLAGYDYTDNSIPMSPVDGRVVNVEYSASGICKAIKQMGNYNEWFVLCRTNLQLEYITQAMEVNKIPYDTFKRSDLSNDELAERMNQNTVKALTIHAAKGLEAKNVIVIGAKYHNIEEICISYVAATRAKELLVWTKTPKKSKKKTVKTENWE